MEIVLIVVMVAIVLAVLYFQVRRERRIELSPLEQRMRYQAANNTRDRMLLIDSAKTPDELDLMAEAWADRGLSKNGLLYANILRAKKARGGSLSALDEERIRQSELALEKAKDLPVIRGRGRN